MNESLMLPAADAAALLGIPPSALNRERRAGHIRAKQIGQRYYYHRGELERYAQDGGIMAVPKNIVWLERTHEHS